MKIRKIKSISFLFEDERVILLPNGKGRFELPTHQRLRGKLKATYRETKVMNIVEHREVKHRDPVLTMEDGEKIRVYQGGDSSYMLAQAAGIIEKFDKISWSSRFVSSVSSGAQQEFPWPDDYGNW